MALDAFPASPVPLVLDADKRTPGAVWVLEVRVAAQAKFPGRIQRKRFDAIRMMGSGTVTVFALDRCMAGRIERYDIRFVTFDAAFPALVLDREIYPLLDVAQPVIPVGKILAVNAEVIGNKEHSGNEDCPD